MIFAQTNCGQEGLRNSFSFFNFVGGFHWFLLLVVKRSQLQQKLESEWGVLYGPEPKYQQVEWMFLPSICMVKPINWASPWSLWLLSTKALRREGCHGLVVSSSEPISGKGICSLELPRLTHIVYKFQTILPKLWWYFVSSVCLPL